MAARFDPDPSREKRERRTRLLVWVESLVIFGLLVWASIEYESNQYLQSWLGEKIGVLGFLLNGTLAGLYAGAMLGYTIAVNVGNKSEEEKILEALSRQRNP